MHSNWAGTVNGCGNSATWRFIPLCAFSQPSPWASIKWQNGSILENNNNKNTSLYGNNIRSHLESTMVDVSRDSGWYVGYLLAAVGWRVMIIFIKTALAVKKKVNIKRTVSDSVPQHDNSTRSSKALSINTILPNNVFPSKNMPNSE